jgi:hypothetical protein
MPLVQDYSQALKFQGSAHKLDRDTVYRSFHTSYSPPAPHTDHLRLLSIQFQPKVQRIEKSVLMHSTARVILFGEKLR